MNLVACQRSVEAMATRFDVWLRGEDTADKTPKLTNDPWAHRGVPFEIDIAEGNDTRDELVSFIDHVRRQDVNTICDI